MFAANMNIFKVCFLVLRNLFLHRRDLIPENLAFRQQLAVQQRTIIRNEHHLYELLTSYITYYNHSRTHLSLERNSPVPRTTELPSQGKVVSIPHVGGLHYLYKRVS